MPSTLIIVALSLLLVAGLHSSIMWLDLFGARAWAVWRRVALASAVGHVLLLGGFLVLAYIDFRVTSDMIVPGIGFSAFLFNNPDFWRVFLVFDTLAAGVVLGVLGLMDAAGAGAGAILGVFLFAASVIGTLQWAAVGGLAGKGLDRMISGLRTPDDEMPDWF